jgi:WD40 repeat protein
VTALAFCPDNASILASASGDETVKLWNTSTGAEIATLGGEGGHTDWVKGISWSPFKAGALASVSDDGQLLIWDTAGG